MQFIINDTNKDIVTEVKKSIGSSSLTSIDPMIPSQHIIFIEQLLNKIIVKKNFVMELDLQIKLSLNHY